MTTYDHRAKWQQIADSLRLLIVGGMMAPGDPLPSEVELARTWEVARGTARNALVALEDQGLVTPGRPRRVARYEPLTVHVARSADHTHPGESPTGGADAWVGDMIAAGQEPTQQIEVVTRTAGSEVADRLGIPVGGIVIARRLTRLAGREPHSLITFWFPMSIAEGTPLAGPASVTEGTIPWLEKMYGPLNHDAWMWPRMPVPDEVELLRIPAGVPVQIVWRTSSSPDRPLVTSMAVYPADRVRLRMSF